MFKKLFIPAIFFVVASGAFAQSGDENPDEAGPSMPNIGVLDETPIDEIAEGSGTILVSGVSVREKPDLNSKVLRTTTQSEKVLVIGESGDWFLIRMYNNREGYILKKYVRTVRIFRDESTTTNSMDKKTSFEIDDLILRFNEVIQESPFALKYQMIPTLRIADGRKSAGVMTLTFIYSCVDLDNKMRPSYKENQLRPQMKQLLELIFAKLLLTNTDTFKVLINVPNFDPEGNVINTNKLYAEINIDHGAVDMAEIKDDVSRIWNYASSTVAVDELFSAFPI